MTHRLAALVLLVAAWMVWPQLGMHQSQKVEQVRWVVSSTPAYKGHPEQPDTIECSPAGDEDLGHTKLIRYARWAELKRDDPCPEEDR